MSRRFVVSNENATSIQNTAHSSNRARVVWETCKIQFFQTPILFFSFPLVLNYEGTDRDRTHNLYNRELPLCLGITPRRPTGGVECKVPYILYLCPRRLRWVIRPIYSWRNSPPTHVTRRWTYPRPSLACWREQRLTVAEMSGRRHQRHKTTPRAQYRIQTCSYETICAGPNRSLLMPLNWAGNKRLEFQKI